MGRGPSDTGWPGVGTANIDLPGVGRVRQEPVQGSRTPAPIPARRLDAERESGLGQTEQGAIRFEIAGKDVLDDGPFDRLDLHASRITGAIWRPTIAVRRTGPWQEDPCPELHLTPTAPAFGDQGAVIFGHGSADLSHEMRLRILPQRLIQKLNPTTSPLEFFQQHHLLDIIPGESIRARDDDTLDRGLFDAVPEPVQSWPLEGGTTVSVVAEDIFRPERFPLCVYLGGESLDLLFNGLG